MKEKRKKLNYVKILEYIMISLLELEIFYITYLNSLSMIKTLILILTIKLSITLIKNERLKGERKWKKKNLNFM